MKNYTAKFSERETKRLYEKYGSVYQGLKRAVSGYNALQPSTLAEIRGLFSREEVVAMTDSLNGTILDEGHMCSPAVMLFGFSDSERLDGRFTAHGADFSAFEAKFEGLTSAQCFFLIEEIRRFWEGDSQDLDGFVSNMIA
jgi:hypothetical protein